MSSLGIFNKETKTYQKVAGTAEAAVVDAEMSDTSTNTVQNKVIKKYVDDVNVNKLDKSSVVDNQLTSDAEIWPFKTTTSKAWGYSHKIKSITIWIFIRYGCVSKLLYFP